MAGHRSYREPRYEFGRLLLTLRTRTGLTQSQLAQELGVHRRSVQNWETGESYPKADALQRLIAFFLEQRVFGSGAERAEAEALWQLVAEDGPQTLPLFDEQWFARTLANREAPTEAAFPPAHQPSLPSPAPPMNRHQPTVGTQDKKSATIIDWGELTVPPMLFGRDDEFATLHQWMVRDQCRVVTIVGLGGIGKSSLAISFARRMAAYLDADAFDLVLFRSLQNAPSLTQVLDQTIRAISEQMTALPESLSSELLTPESPAEKVALLVQLLRERRCLLILDNFETLLQPGTLTGSYRAGYEEYGLLLRAIAERAHQSCLLLTSREKPAELGPWEGRTAPVRTLALAGLRESAGQRVLEAKELRGTTEELHALARLYGGNPLALNLVSEPIHEIFGGDVAAFLATDDAFFNGMSKLLDQQFARSSPLEQSILYWLAIARELVPFHDLVAMLSEHVSQREVMSALESLRRRMLIERSPDRPAFILQPVILEYLTEQLHSSAYQEVVTGRPALLPRHPLIQATAKEYLRRSQEQLIAMPLLERLTIHFGDAVFVERQLVGLLDAWRNKPLAEQGYGPGNVTHLLRLLRGHLRDLNLARLSLRQLYLQGVEVQNSTMAGAMLQEGIFTEPFDALTAIAISSSGEEWAAISRRGEVMVWGAGGQPLHRTWRAHTALVWTIVFSPDGTLLATGSWDGTVKVWEVHRSTLLWAGRHIGPVNRVAFSHDGTMLASGGSDGVVHLWNVRSGAPLQTLPQPAPVSVVRWHPTKHLLATGDMEGTIRLWEAEPSGTFLNTQTLAEHSAWVDGLVFSPDGRMLASASYEGAIKLWEVTSGRVMETISAHMESVHRLAWSSNGRYLASCSFARRIWLWDVEERALRAPLQGHTASVYDLAFTPDSSTLISASEDGTLRVWEVAHGQCVRVMQGYVGALYEIDWSPDSTKVVSVGTDALMTIYSVADGKPLQVLGGQMKIAIGVGWCANGRWLASSEIDNAILLWDAHSGAFVETLRHPDDSGNLFYRLAWSPITTANGQQVACGTASYGVMVWDVTERRFVWSGEAFPTKIRHVAWSPDGTRLAGGGDDGVVYVWNAARGELLLRLVGHGSMITSLAWSPTGNLLAASSSGQEDGKVMVWDAARGERVDTIAAHPGSVEAVAWGIAETAGEPLLISGGDDGKVRWWHVARGECVRVRDAHNGVVRSLKRSPDGQQLASCGDDGMIMTWNLQSSEVVQRVRRDRPYERLDITGLTGITQAQRASLVALGAVERMI